MACTDHGPGRRDAHREDYQYLGDVKTGVTAVVLPGSRWQRRGERARRACARSPESRRLIRLVIRSVTPGQTPRISPNPGAAVTTCSKLSSTRSRRMSASTSIRRSCNDAVPMSRNPSVPAMVSWTRSGFANRSEIDEGDAVGKGAKFTACHAAIPASARHAQRTAPAANRSSASATTRRSSSVRGACGGTGSPTGYPR
jgi:hypothetical protein